MSTPNSLDREFFDILANASDAKKQLILELMRAEAERLAKEARP